MSTTTEVNKNLIRSLLAEVDHGNNNVVEAYYSPDYVDHTHGLGLLEQLGIAVP